MKSGSNSFALSENASTTSKLQSQSPIAPYLPDNLINAKYYHPKDNKNEKILKDIMDKLETL